MTKEVCDRILASIPNITEDLFDLMMKGELTSEEYGRIIDANAPYLDTKRGCLAVHPYPTESRRKD